MRRAKELKKPQKVVCTYSLHELKQYTIEFFIKNMKLRILRKGSLACFVHLKPLLTSPVTCENQVVGMALKKRKEVVGNFLASVRKVNAIQISVDDFGDCCHMASSEPYFYDQSYANGKL